MDYQRTSNISTNPMSNSILANSEATITNQAGDTYSTPDVETLATNEILQMYDRNYYITAIGGTVIAILSIIVVFIGLIIFCLRHRKKKEISTVDQSFKCVDDKASSKFKWEALLNASAVDKTPTKIESQTAKSTITGSKLATTATDGTAEAAMMASISVPMNPEEQFMRLTAEEVAERQKMSVTKSKSKSKGVETQKVAPGTDMASTIGSSDKSAEKRPAYVKVKRKSVAAIKRTTQSGTASTTS